MFTVLMVCVLGCTPAPTDKPAESDTLQSLSSAPAVVAESAAMNPDLHKGYVGRSSCATCHETEHTAWLGSHHDKAMQPATTETVLGDFSGTTFEKDGVISRFYREGDTFMVDTDGADGTIQPFKVAYTFGVHPLQQYLIAFPDGRMQVLGLCWDSRSIEAGGQRWFHLYEDEPIPHDDILHWTGVYQNWNFMCAECHSTDLQKGYDPSTNRFQTSWAEIDVSCETCHGPGENHVNWAQQHEGTAPGTTDDMGLTVRLKEKNLARWVMQPHETTAERVPARTSQTEIDTCARCHSRRSQLREHYAPGKSILNSHLVEALEAPLYFDDGQIRDEVYVYGSYVQSKMFHGGVTCSDCHDPHSVRTYIPGNGLCAQCHLPSVYDSPAHHFHQEGSTGAQCVECHMPERIYMVVDPRRDHSIRIPRPDLSIKLGSPNACIQCHTDQSNTWAAEHVATWFPDREHPRHFGEDLALGRKGAPEGIAKLITRTQDLETPDIVRATALSSLVNRPSQESVLLGIELLKDDSPMVRINALKMMQYIPPEERWPLVRPLLEDAIATARHEATHTLADLPLESLDTADRKKVEEAFATYVDTLQFQADRPDTHLNLGIFHYKRGNLTAAENDYKKALSLEPKFAQARFNLADLYRAMQRDSEGESLLRAGIKLDPKAWILHHALGLLLHRQGQSDESLVALQKAALGAPEDARFQYVYAIALNSAGRPGEALMALEDAQVNHPYAMDIATTLVSISLEQGQKNEAQKHLEYMKKQWPNAPETQSLTQQVEGP